MSTFLPKGFKNLPVSSGIVGGLLVIPLVVSLLDLKPYFLFSFDPFIKEWHQYWRILILQAQFQNQSEILLSIVLVGLKLKNLERIYGSDRFIKHLILLSIYNLIGISIVSIVGYSMFGYNIFFPSGPFGLIFGLIYSHHLNTPINYQIELNFKNVFSLQPFGREVTIVFNDKFDIYLLSLILMFNEGLISSPIVSIMGYIIGYLYFNGLLPITDASIKYQIVAMNGESPVNEETSDEDPALPPRTILQQVFGSGLNR